ncbi:MAG: tetratricopeptide repeat protein [Xanthomonadaceae bacterium]|nr:tetratricopeptide repeat protein [Xanthomonadaceae bacterium]
MAPASATELTERALEALEAGDTEQAVALLEPAHRSAPRDAQIAHALALVELSRGNSERALELAELATRHGGTVAEHHHLLGLALAMNIDSMGTLGKMRAAGRMRGAWERALELDPDHIEARFSLFGYYLGAPRIAGGGRDKAEAMAVTIAERDPVRGHRARAVMLRIDGDDDGALREFDAAAELVADDPEQLGVLLMARGFLCQQMERWDCAHDAFIATLAADPERLGALYQIGRTAVFSDSRHEEGIAAFQRYVAEHAPRGSDPSHAWAHVRTGTLLEKLGRPDDARAEYQAALALDSDHTGAKDALAALAPR